MKFREVSGIILSQLVNYCYTLRIRIDVANVMDILAAAHLFQLDNVVAKCETFFSSQIAAPNAFDYLALAENYTLVNLRYAARKYLCREFNAVVEDRSFLELSVNNVIEYLCDDNILVASERVVFNAAMKWIESAREDRRQYYPVLMDTLRTSKIDYPVRSHQFISFI